MAGLTFVDKPIREDCTLPGIPPAAKRFSPPGGFSYFLEVAGCTGRVYW